MTVVWGLRRRAELEATSRKYGVTAATLTRWREAFLEGGESGLKIRATDVVDEERRTLKSGCPSGRRHIQSQGLLVTWPNHELLRMMTRNTTPFLLNLCDFDVHEPGISNDEFLDSLNEIGVWLRVLAAYDSLKRYSSPDSTRAERMAALSNIYLQLGAQLEDQAVSLIVFSIWSKNRDLVLADLFFRTFVTRPRKSTTGSEIAAVHDRLTGHCTGTVRVDPRAFFGEVVEMDDAAIVEFFLGYKWRPVPSVKLIPKKHIQVWTNLPGEFRRIASSFYDEKHVPRITAAYNKLKHGPQLILQNPIDRARRFGSSSNLDTQLAGYRALDKTGIRLLFAGAKTRREPSDSGVGSVAPFLIDDEGAVRKLVFETMVYQAMLFNTLVRMQLALYRRTRFEIGNFDEGVSRLIEEAQRRLSNTYA